MRGEFNYKIGDEKRLLKFCTFQTIIYNEMVGIGLEEYKEHLTKLFNKTDSGMIFIRLVYSALVAGASFEKKEFEGSLEDVAFWIDDIDGGDFTKKFYESLLGSETVPKKKPKITRKKAQPVKQQ